MTPAGSRRAIVVPADHPDCDYTARAALVDEAAVDTVLTASRSLIAVATQSLGAATQETTIAQYRALMVLASRGTQRTAALTAALNVAPSTARRMRDRPAHKQLIRRHRAYEDRRAVLVAITPAGRGVIDHATGWRRAPIADILARLPAHAQLGVAQAPWAFADAARGIPDSPGPPAASGRVPAMPGPRPPDQPGIWLEPVPSVQADATERP